MEVYPCAADFPVTPCSQAASDIGIGETGQVWKQIQTGEACSKDRYVQTFCVLIEPDPANKLNCCLGLTKEPYKCNGIWCPDVCREDPDIIKYCTTGSNITTDECIYFCPLTKTENRASWCDSAFEDYCATEEGRSDPLCSCINSSIPFPSCFDTQCSGSGYQRSRDIAESKDCAGGCVKIETCMKTGQCKVDESVFKRNCSNIPNPQPPSPNGKTDGDTFLWVIGGIVGFLVLLAIIGAIIYFIWGRGKNSSEEASET